MPHVDPRPGTGERSDRAPGDEADADAPRCRLCGRVLRSEVSRVAWGRTAVREAFRRPRRRSESRPRIAWRPN